MASLTPLEQALQKVTDLRNAQQKEQEQLLAKSLNWIQNRKTAALTSINSRLDNLIVQASALRQPKSAPRRSSSRVTGSTVFHTPPSSQPEHSLHDDDIFNDQIEHDHVRTPSTPASPQVRQYSSLSPPTSGVESAPAESLAPSRHHPTSPLLQVSKEQNDQPILEPSVRKNSDRPVQPVVEKVSEKESTLSKLNNHTDTHQEDDSLETSNKRGRKQLKQLAKSQRGNSQLEASISAYSSSDDESGSPVPPVSKSRPAKVPAKAQGKKKQATDGTERSSVERRRSLRTRKSEVSSSHPSSTYVPTDAQPRSEPGKDIAKEKDLEKGGAVETHFVDDHVGDDRKPTGNANSRKNASEAKQLDSTIDSDDISQELEQHRSSGKRKRDESSNMAAAGSALPKNERLSRSKEQVKEAGQPSHLSTPTSRVTKKVRVGDKSLAKSPTSAGQFAVDAEGKISSAGISALFSVPSKPKEPEPTAPSTHTKPTTSQANRVGFMSIADGLPPQPPASHLRSTEQKQFTSSKKSLLAHTPGARAPVVGGSQSVNHPLSPPRQALPETDDRIKDRIFTALNRTPGAKSLELPSTSGPSKAPLVSKVDNIPSTDLMRRIAAKNSQAMEKFNSWCGTDELNISWDRSHIQEPRSLHPDQPKTALPPKRPARMDKIKPKSELRRRIELVRAENSSGDLSSSTAQPPLPPLPSLNTVQPSSAFLPSERLGKGRTSILSNSTTSRREGDGSGRLRPRNSVRFIDAEVDCAPMYALDDKDSSNSQGKATNVEETPDNFDVPVAERPQPSSSLQLPKNSVRRTSNAQSLVVPRTRNSMSSNDGISESKAASQDLMSIQQTPSPAEKKGGPLSNLMTSMTSFLPMNMGSSILGTRKIEERTEEEEAELEAKRQKVDAERREAELQARRDAARLQKQREMREKKRRAEANRRELEEAERVKDEERRRREEQRRLRRQKEEEDKRKRKEEEDRKKEERRRMVLEKKKQEQRAEEEKQKAAARRMMLNKAYAAGSSKSSSKAGRDLMPPPPSKARNPDNISSYDMTPSKETFLEESDEEHERRQHKVVPSWASSPRLNESIRNQPDPDQLFSHTPMCNLGEVFGENRRYRTRSSSVNWTRDRATAQEMAAYRRVMNESSKNNP